MMTDVETTAAIAQECLATADLLRSSR